MRSVAIVLWLLAGFLPAAEMDLVSGFGLNSTESIGGQDTTLWSGMAMWSSQVAERVNVALSARYQTQSGTTQFDEAALLATLNMTF